MGTWLQIGTLHHFLWQLPNNMNHLQFLSLLSISSHLHSWNDYANCFLALQFVPYLHFNIISSFMMLKFQWHFPPYKWECSASIWPACSFWKMSDIEVSFIGCDISEEPSLFILNHEDGVSRLFQNVGTHFLNCMVSCFRKT